jgi:hypothetical protein
MTKWERFKDVRIIILDSRDNHVWREHTLSVLIRQLKTVSSALGQIFLSGALTSWNDNWDIFCLRLV